jgi:hypothetical protein
LRVPPPDLRALLRKEASLALGVIVTPPNVVGIEVWQKLLELQCRRIGQLYAELRRCLGAAQAQKDLQGILETIV